MLRKLIATDADRTTAMLRIALAVVILPHGAQKLLGWFGGAGPAGTIGFFDATWGIPAFLTMLVIAAESLGGLALLSGFAGRVAAAGVAAVMVGAVALQHAGNGFFMNWTGQQAGEGFEFHILAIALALAVVVKGSGAWSIDRLLSTRATVVGSTEHERPLRRAA